MKRASTTDLDHDRKRRRYTMEWGPIQKSIPGKDSIEEMLTLDQVIDWIQRTKAQLDAIGKKVMTYFHDPNVVQLY